VKNFIIIISLLLILSCSQKQEEIVTVIKGDDIEDQMLEAYNEGMIALERKDILFAAKKFNEAELLYPQSEWAPKASLMAAYSYWSDGYYRDSINELKRFLDVYNFDPRLPYAYYLLGMNYYESIVDEKKDLKALEESSKYFNILIKEFPETDYALDAKYKIDLITDLLAAKEMYIARYYIKREKWIAAINRLNFIIKNFSTTIYIEEALHRMVEIHYILGLEDQAKIYASTLGYNYQSSEWYEQTYKIFNKNYDLIINERKKTNRDHSLIKKIKNLF
jgi:outer membrane protein assembly factor BamD